jgi:hypothetical protein
MVVEIADVGVVGSGIDRPVNDPVEYQEEMSSSIGVCFLAYETFSENHSTLVPCSIHTSAIDIAAEFAA